MWENEYNVDANDHNVWICAAFCLHKFGNILFKEHWNNEGIKKVMSWTGWPDFELGNKIVHIF